jgi:hypothetical protein
VFERERYAWFFSGWLQGIKRGDIGPWIDDCLIENIESNLSPLAKGSVIKASDFCNDLIIIDYDQFKANIVEPFLGDIGI